MTDIPDIDDALQIIESEAVAAAQSQGVANPTALGQMVTQRVADRLGGRLVYIAKEARKVLAARNERIRASFNGRNVDELAKLYGLTPRQVRKILKRP